MASAHSQLPSSIPTAPLPPWPPTFPPQSQLEADRSAAEARAVSLQSEVVKLQERINALLAARELGDNVRASAAEGEGGGVKNLDWRGTMADRDRIIALVSPRRRLRQRQGV